MSNVRQTDLNLDDGNIYLPPSSHSCMFTMKTQTGYPPPLLSLLAVGRVRVGIRDFTVPITDFLRFIKGQGALSLGER